MLLYLEFENNPRQILLKRTLEALVFAVFFTRALLPRVQFELPLQRLVAHHFTWEPSSVCVSFPALKYTDALLLLLQEF